MRRILAIASALVSLASVGTRAVAQTVPALQTFPLTDTRSLVAKGIRMDTAEFLELSFTGEWPNTMIDGTPGAVTTTLAGWFDGASGRGRSKIDPRADGQWTATRQSGR